MHIAGITNEYSRKIITVLTLAAIFASMFPVSTFAVSTQDEEVPPVVDSEILVDDLSTEPVIDTELPVPPEGEGEVNEVNEETEETEENILNNEEETPREDFKARAIAVPEIERCERNLIENGSFEEPLVEMSELWDSFSSVDPWTITTVNDATPTTLELMRGWSGNAAAHGEQYAELDGSVSTNIAQTVNTIPGATYELSWAFAARHNIDASHNELAVRIDGDEVATHGPAAGVSPLTAGDWERGSETFVSIGTSTTVEFRDLGPSNSYGTYLDDVQLCLVEEPEPTSCTLTILSDTDTVIAETNMTAVPTYDDHSAWTASIPGATWIWGSATVTNPSVDTIQTFVETFTVTNPTSATLTIAADNGYEVFLNGVSIQDNLMVENNFQLSTQDSIPLTLVSGANELKIVVKNMAQPGGTYMSNPAGVLFRLTATGTSDCTRTTEVETSGSVTMCKYDNFKKPLSGWQLMLLGDKYGEMSVLPDTNGAVQSLEAVPAGNYVIKASGTYVYRPGGLLADAAFSTRLPGDPGYDSLPYQPWQSSTVYGPTDNYLGLQVNGTLPWGTTFNAGHVYYAGISLVTADDLDFKITDTYYTDNTGSILAEVYTGWIGTTGKNGCVTFSNVPFGTYDAHEVMQEGWEYVSGQGPVEVTHTNTPKTITIVNKQEDVPEPFTIDGYKFNDRNGNGEWDGSNEETLAGWKIELRSGEELIETAFTDEDGYYSFTVPAGSYQVSEVQQEGWEQTATLGEADGNICYFDFSNDEASLSFLSFEFELPENPFEDQFVGQCVFGNQQDQEEITEPEPPRQSTRRSSSGTQTRAPASAPEGRVLGAATQQCMVIEDFMQVGWENRPSEVLKLQVFLNAYLGINNPLNGVFDEATEEAVISFQNKFHGEIIQPWFDKGIVPHDRATGFVYKLTRWKINEILCPGHEPYPSFEGEDLTQNVLIGN